MRVIVISIVVVYMLIMLFIGWYSSKKISSNEDFMLAGRRLGPLLMAGTLAATEIGGGSSLGVVEKSFGDWGIDANWYVTTMGIAFIILSFLAPKFRQSEVKTVPEYFRRRYGRKSGFITSIIMLLPLIGLTASQFIASSTIVSVMLGWDYKVAVTIVALVVTVYSVLGGLWSVTMTDFVQVFLIVVGMIIAVPFALNTAGGFEMVQANVPAETFQLFKGVGPVEIISLIIMYIASFTVGQEAVSRYYAARDPKAAVQGSIISAIINFVYAFIPTILGIITLSLINMGKLDESLILKNGAYYALPHLAMTTMPAIIVGLLFAGIISATMSSADSDLLGAGSIFANDIYKIYLNKDASSDKVMRTTQITMVIVGIFGWFIAFTNTKSIISILMFSFTLRAAGSFFPYIFGLYWSKSSEAGTIASLITGSAVVLGFQYIPVLSEFAKNYKLNSIIPALFISIIFFVVFSKLFPPKIETTNLTEDF
ncbi:solute:Na+ symporter, SSS family [Peptoniphilus asaccharolyticus DSM 20463]|uniref:Solute:Na+ symporter, SSS family n=1 Tax=Peptoniphilus asaccharolyticus DSM 20463 TaxID=573058 RepID=A0A1W1V2Y1_PEPAS|nr:sodium:solute symporter family protein [Peptoniphilus asaccharolyticus]MBL7576157.1 sodium:solute symporter family protein [Peptoniphilus asaccharolyticus]SMB87636.1 solute:Na+ symporter, SSS family [Peptoniphilus asaccharolyticus DSM 20463]